MWGDGQVARDYLHVTDLVRACSIAATTESADPVYNIGTGQEITLNRLLEAISETVGRSFRVIRLPGRPFDVPRLALDSRHANEQLGWLPQITLAAGLLDTWRWVASSNGCIESPSRPDLALWIKIDLGIGQIIGPCHGCVA